VGGHDDVDPFGGDRAGEFAAFGANAGETDLALLLQARERFNAAFQPFRIGAVQIDEIEPVAAEARKALLYVLADRRCGKILYRRAARPITRSRLGADEYRLAEILQHPAEPALALAAGVKPSRVEMP